VKDGSSYARIISFGTFILYSIDMSGFEVVGVVLGIWPEVIDAVDMYEPMRGGRGVHLLQHQLNTEEFIFRQFVIDLLSSDVSEADLIQLSDRNSPNMGLWRDKRLHSVLERRLGPEQCRVVLGSLVEMNKLLINLTEKLTSNNVDAVGYHIPSLLYSLDNLASSLSLILELTNV
jgi:hypothetical protein